MAQFPSPFAPPLIPFLCVCVCMFLCDIDPHHATVTGLRAASTQGTTRTDSRWQRQRKTDPCKILLLGRWDCRWPNLLCSYGTICVLSVKAIYSFKMGECVPILCPAICLPAAAHFCFMSQYELNFHQSGQIHTPDNH